MYMSVAILAQGISARTARVLRFFRSPGRGSSRSYFRAAIMQNTDIRLAMARALMEAAVRSAVGAGAPRRTVAAVAAAVATSSMADGHPPRPSGQKPGSASPPPTQHRSEAAGGDAPSQTQVGHTRPGRRRRRRRKPPGMCVALETEPNPTLPSAILTSGHAQPPRLTVDRRITNSRGVKAQRLEEGSLDRGDGLGDVVAKSRRRTISNAASTPKSFSPRSGGTTPSRRRSDSPGGSESASSPTPSRRRLEAPETAQGTMTPWAFAERQGPRVLATVDSEWAAARARY
jgi:hypothetical protein